MDDLQIIDLYWARDPEAIASPSPARTGCPCL